MEQTGQVFPSVQALRGGVTKSWVMLKVWVLCGVSADDSCGAVTIEGSGKLDTHRDQLQTFLHYPGLCLAQPQAGLEECMAPGLCLGYVQGLMIT